ncbi:MAG: hypothetical protein KBD78_07610 [Oligoflexales bacterium]|nr:hypothetical protein [Oligoflexales bacterium]
MKQLINIILFVGIYCSFLHHTHAQIQNQNKNPAQDATIILPWRFVGVDSELKAELKVDLNSARKLFVSSNFSNLKSLSEYTNEYKPKRSVLISHRNFIEDTFVSNTSKNFIIEPVLCQSGQKYLLYLLTQDSKSGENSGIDHSSMTFAELRSNRTSAKYVEQISSALNSTYRNILAANLQQGNSNSQLKLALNLKRETQDNPIGGASYCYNLLLAQLLQGKFRLSGLVDAQASSLISDFYPELFKLSRPNRLLNIVWYFYRDQNDKNKKLLSYKIDVSEAVFGKSLGRTFSQSDAFKLDETHRFDLALFQPMIDFLKSESDQLIVSQNPRALQQNGAWFYLDKGRAWGLRINDRLTSIENPEVKGHIVSFFGPESGIRNAREEMIAEGAIVFIREGLEKAQIGMQYAFDRSSYPAQIAP